MAAARSIVRYSNRKVYDTLTSRYTNLTALADLVRQGVRIEVRDHDGGDRTAVTMAEILAADLRDGGDARTSAALLDAVVAALPGARKGRP